MAALAVEVAVADLLAKREEKVAQAVMEVWVEIVVDR
jgi:hypothetical protein